MPGAGFETRWTIEEKRQAVVLNRDIERFCRMPAAGMAWGSTIWGKP